MTQDAIITLRCRVDGREATLEIAEADAEALRARLDRVRVPIKGYAALQAALQAQGIKVGIRTLKERVSERQLPHRKFGRAVTFYLPEVLERIGGRTRIV